MAAHFTLGIEEEFQTVDQLTGQLRPHIMTILEKGRPIFGEQLKPEMLQPTVELISDVYPDIRVARAETQRLRGQLAQLLADEGLTLISAGTHPTATWTEQPVTPYPRYDEILEEFQDVGRSVLIYGLHIHVAVPGNELAITLMNQLRTWLPHLLALSSNSPFWAGRLTGLKSYRAIVWKRLPRSGLPDSFASWSDFDHYVQTLISTGCIDNGKKIWWDVRPHPTFGTIELRICDMPATLNDVIGLAALYQSLIAKLNWLHLRGKAVPIIPRHFLEENKWRATRYGLDTNIVDFSSGCHISIRDSIHELLDMVDEVADDLGTRPDLHYIRSLVDDPRGTGADRQIALYRETGNIHAVTRYLMEQTLAGIAVEEVV
jgi:glutamate---cysteine ligase / carboxylate-amine ligase